MHKIYDMRNDLGDVLEEISKFGSRCCNVTNIVTQCPGLDKVYLIIEYRPLSYR